MAQKRNARDAVATNGRAAGKRSAAIYERLRNWNPWWALKSVPEEMAGRKRAMLGRILKWIDEREVKVLVGPRRAGKSTLFYQLIEHIGKKNGFENVLLVNLQDKVLSQMELDEIYLSFREHSATGAKAYVFLDEAQEKDGWEEWIKGMYDMKRDVSFFVSGSSAGLLKSDYSAYLSGRMIEFEVFPLSFGECLSFAGIAALATDEDAARAKSLFRQYSAYGGFPEVYFKREELRAELLHSYVEDFLERDVVRRHNANREKLEYLFRWIATNAGKPTSYSNLGKTLGISEEAVSQYIGYLREAYLIIEVKGFSPSLSKQEMLPKCYYPIDIGFMLAYGFSMRSEEGKVLEAAVAINLHFAGKRLFSHRSGFDVDFIYEMGSRQFAGICATYEPELEREKKGAAGALFELKLKQVSFVTFDRKSIMDIEGKQVRCIPFCSWALDMDG